VRTGSFLLRDTDGGDSGVLDIGPGRVFVPVPPLASAAFVSF